MNFLSIRILKLESTLSAIPVTDGAPSVHIPTQLIGDKSGARAGFLRELRLPLPMYIPSGSPQSSSLLPEAGTIGQEWPQCQ
jgi:hypothetical protein